MSAGRIILASLLGGAAIFAWGAVEHMATPLGGAGMQNLPAAGNVVPSMKVAINEPGLYVFPEMPPEGATESDMKAWEERVKQGPNGMVLYNPSGGECMGVQQLGAEFGSNVLAAFMLALIIARARTTRIGGGMIGLATGVFAWLSVSASHWNWYGFPNAFALAELVEQSVGGMVGGFVVALVLGRPRPVM